MVVHIPLISHILYVVEGFLHQTLKLALFFSLLFAALHRLGVIQRVIHRLAEDALSNVLNGAKVTMSNIEVDVITGQFVATDALIHTPDCDKFKWDSPIIARFGRVTGKISLVSLLDPIASYCGYTWREFYYIICEDIQVFIEKRRNIFNFHLLDESLHIPEPVSGGIENSNATDELSKNSDLMEQHKEDFSTVDNNTTTSAFEPSNAAGSSSGNSSIVVGDIASSAAEKKANEIVSSMLKTVSTLGKAANKGGKNELDRLLKNQRDNIVKSLREFQDKGISTIKPMVSTDNAFFSTDSNPRQGSSSMEVMARESLKVVRSMGKAVERNVNEIQQSLKPPQKKDGYKSPDDWIRIGWVTFRDVRIFTKDVILSSSNSSSSPSKKSNSFIESTNAANKAADPSTNEARSSRNFWSVPILLKEVAFSGQDLSHPVSVRDNGLPVIGLKPDQLVDIFIRRAVSEMAKTNTGRLFSNAMGEFFAWMDVVGNANSAISVNNSNHGVSLRP